jgi:hypothetical protein
VRLLITRNAFQKESLLLVKHVPSATARWVRSEQILRSCPSFVRYTTPVSDFGSIYYARLHELLDLRTWDSEHHLRTELEHGISEMTISDGEDGSSVASYVFQALSSIAQDTRISCAPVTCPAWVRSILRLSIFPIRTSSGQCTLQALGPNIFIPDSEDLKESFQGKVNLLDFGDNYIWDVLPVLRCSEAALKYLSDYNDPSTMEVKILEPVTDDTDTLGEVWKRRLALTR